MARGRRHLSCTALAVAQHVPVRIRVAEISAQIDAAAPGAALLAIARADYTRVTLEQRLLLRRDFTYAVRMVRAAMEDDLIKMLEQAADVSRGWPI